MEKILFLSMKQKEELNVFLLDVLEGIDNIV